MILILSALGLALGILLGHGLGRARKWTLFFALMVAVIALFFGGVYALRQQQGTGFDGVAEAALLVLGLLPLEIGGLIGAGIAAIRNRRERDG